MRNDLLEGWAKTVTAPLNDFDLLLMSMIPNFEEHEAISKAINETENTVIPAWFPLKNAIYLKEYHKRFTENPPNFDKASFEDFSDETSQKLFIEHLLKSANGQIELGMFLRKGLITCDETVFSLCVDYLVHSLAYFDRFPQVLDHLITGISLESCKKAYMIAEKTISCLSENKVLCEELGSKLMDLLQVKHLIDNDESCRNGLKPCDYSVKLTPCLWIWLIVLFHCLKKRMGIEGVHGEIDLLLTLSYSVNSKDTAYEINWLRALLLVFSSDAHNHQALSYCTKRLDQLIKAESISYESHKQYQCNEALANLLNDPSSLLTFTFESETEVCPLTTDVLNLLNVLEMENEDDKGKTSSVVVDVQRQLHWFIMRMEDWIRQGVRFNPDFLKTMCDRFNMFDEAWRLKFEYEKRFATTVVIPMDHKAQTDNYRYKILATFSLDAWTAVKEALFELPETVLKSEKDIVTKLLTKHVLLIIPYLEKFEAAPWAYKQSWEALLIAFQSEYSLDCLTSSLAVCRQLVDVTSGTDSNTLNHVAMVKYSRTFFQTLEERYLSLLASEFPKKSETVVATLKSIQTCMRPLHLLCGNKKLSEDISASIPPLKRTLELILFKVKMILKENNCLSAFSIGIERETA